MAKRLKTIEWMIKFIGDHGCAERAHILKEGRKAGYSSGTLRHYLTSAAWFGHVATEDCTTEHKNRRVNRTEYFRRPRRGWYTLNPRYIARYASMTQSKSAVALAAAYGRGEKVIHITTEAKPEDFFGMPVFRKEHNTSERSDVLEYNLF